MASWLGRSIDWILMVALVAAAVWIAVCRPFGIEAAPSGSLAGALFSGAAVLLANAINRMYQRTQADKEREQRLAKLKRIVRVELSDVASGLLDAKRLVDAAITSSQAEASPQAPALRPYMPRPLSVTRDLVTDLLLLDESAIDALVTLQANLAVTRTTMESIVPGTPFGQIAAQPVSNGLAHDLEMLAVAFERIVPDVRLKRNDQPPALAAEVLRKAAQPPRDPRQPPA